MSQPAPPPPASDASSAPVARPVDFGAAITSAFRNYARFEGTASVSEFWWFTLFSALVYAALGTLDELVMVAQSGTSGVLATLWALATLLPSLALAVRRLRDGGNSALQLLWLLVPIAGLIVLALRFCDPSRGEPQQRAADQTPAVPHDAATRPYDQLPHDAPRI